MPLAPSQTFRDHRSVTGNDVKIVATKSRVSVEFGKTIDPQSVFVVQIWRQGKMLVEHPLNARNNFASSVPPNIDTRECGVRVCFPTGIVIAELDVAVDEHPYRRPRAEQVHITENYVSVPPALTITDEVNSVWTLGLIAAPKHKCPAGEFAFAVLRNGFDVGEMASRIERRNGKVRIFTVEGWKKWTGASFF
jgi:hypothetical protein